MKKKPNSKKPQNLKPQHELIWVPETWTRGSHDHIYIDEMTVFYSLN